MRYVFFDDSKHPRLGFCLSAFVMLSEDPAPKISEILRSQALVPGRDEFKSSAHMGRHPEQQRIRARFKHLLMDLGAAIGVAVAPEEGKLGHASLQLLSKALTHESVTGQPIRAFFDEGFFPQSRLRAAANSMFEARPQVELFLEQQSHQVLGIQLADMIAHLCSIMLLERLGAVNKKLTVGPASLYPPGTEIELGFQLWSAARYWFLSKAPVVDPETIDESYRPIADVTPYGLYLDPELTDDVRNAANERFGEMYMGCIH